MRLVLDNSLFNVRSEAEATSLVDLFITVARDLQYHVLLTDPPYLQGADNGPIDAWLDRRDPWEARAFRRVLSAGLLGHAARPIGGHASDSMAPRRWHLAGALMFRVERRTECDWRLRLLSLPEAVDLLREPVHLVSENERTEPAFMRHLAGPTNGATLRALMSEPGRIERHGGGGGAAKTWIKALTTGAPTSEKWRRMLRAWVLFDQDADDADAREPSASAVDLMHACEQVVAAFGAGLSWICLRRREIESYVPDSGLQTQRADRKTLTDQILAWRKNAALAPWAWAMDLKNGLHGDRHPKWKSGLSEADVKAVKERKKPLEPHMLKAPFSGLSAPEIGALTWGLADALGESLRAEVDPTWASDLPAEYDRGPADQAPRDLLVQSLFDRM